MVMVVLAAPPIEGGARIAVHPLEVIGGDARGVDQSRADFLVEVARQPIQLVPPTQVIDALEAVPGKSCVEQRGCLEQICKDTRSVYAVLAILSLEGPAFLANARVVAADGTVVRVVDRVTLEKDPFSPRGPQVQTVLRQLFLKLELGTLPAELPKKAEAPAVARAAPPPVVVQPAQPSAGTPPLRVAGLIVGGVAVATAGVGVAMGVVSLGNGRALGVDNDGNLPANDPSAVTRAKELDAFNNQVIGVFAAAGVVAITSALMIAVSAGSGDGPSVSLAPINGGAVVGVKGTF